MELSKIGQAIKQHRKRVGLTQQELAHIIGKTESSIRKYEKGLVQIPIEVVEQIATTFEITPFDLMEWDYLDVKQGQNIKDYDAFESYLSRLGYSMTAKKTGQSESGIWEEHKDGDVAVGRSFIPDEEFWEVELTKESKGAIFSGEEFSELQTAIKDVIETRFYKKIMEAQTKK